MAEAQDKDAKTEEATEKRREEALESGNTPVSRELSNLGFAFALLAAVAFMSEPMAGRLAATLSAFLERPEQFRLATAADTSMLLRAVATETMGALAPLVLVLLLTAVLFQIVQTPPRLSWKRLEIKASRISPRSGLQRILSSTGLVELAKSIGKLALLGVVGGWYLQAPHSTLVNALATPATMLPDLIVAASAAVLVPVSAGFAVLAIGDLVFSRVSWARRLRMTLQEVRDEAKQSEGDPALAHRRRSIARARLKRMMTTGVPRATVVIANPTHYAVALRYVRSEGGTPLVVAKGQDLIALQIRKIAEEKSIPVVEDKALARSLYAAVELDQAIPREFYSAVANVMLMLRKLGNRKVIEALEG